MARKVAIPCADCGRKFGGQDTLDRHRVIAGDRYRCRSDSELPARGFWRDRYGVWHRGPIPGQESLWSAGEDGRTAVTPTDPTFLARSTDPITSKVAAKHAAYRTGTAKARLLAVYLDAYLEGPHGLTDEEAAARVGMDLYQATKRCSDLRRDGMIAPIGVRKGAAGMDRQVCSYVSQAVSA